MAAQVDRLVYCVEFVIYLDFFTLLMRWCQNVVCDAALHRRLMLIWFITCTVPS